MNNYTVLKDPGPYVVTFLFLYHKDESTLSESTLHLLSVIYLRGFTCHMIYHHCRYLFLFRLISLIPDTPLPVGRLTVT